MLYQIRNGKLEVGGNIILENFDFTIKGQEKAALVGANGAGKSVFLRMLAGQLSLERDERRPGQGIYMPRPVSIGLLEQTPYAGSDRTVEEEIRAVCPAQDPWDRDRFDFEQEYDRLFTGFGFAKEEKGKRLSAFSGGERTKIALIRLLLMRPDLLLLDEPTNHLDLESTQWLEAYLRRYPGAVLVVSHDRFFLDETVDLVYELENGRLTRYAGNYTAYRKEKQRALAAAERRWRRQQEELDREEALIKRFRNKAKKASFARSRKKIMERMEKIPRPGQPAAHIFTGEMIPRTPGPRWVLETKDLQAGYAGKALFSLNIRIRRGQKIAVIGKNGAGKSTLLKTITGQIPPVGGKFVLGEGVDYAYFDQLTAQMDGEDRVIDHFRREFPEMEEKDARHTLAQYLFRGALAAQKISSLSGGEKARLRLAEILCASPNLLILDEPTNHMDLPAKETLESAFCAYQGTMLLISHDRYLISQVADALLVLEEGRAIYYPFGYRHYLEKNQSSAKEENQALISSLRSVPKGSSLLGRKPSEADAALEWELEQAWERLDREEKNLLWLEEAVEELRAEALTKYCLGDPGWEETEDAAAHAAERLETARMEYARAAVLCDELQRGWDVIPPPISES